MREHAEWMLAGTFAWVAFGLVLMFDMLLTTCVLLGLLGLVEAARTDRAHGHALYGVAIGLGILAKGPVILLHLLPAALLAPAWRGQGGDRRWYRRTAAAVAGGLVVAGLWVVPAALLGGDTYREKILWTQTAGRVSESFAHARPWWYYLAILPLLALPWMLWPRVWAGVAQRVRELDRGTRFLLCAFVPVFAGFSAISGKQLHYLLPWVPAIVLVGVAGLLRKTAGTAPIRLAAPALTWIALPVVAALAIALMAGGWSAVHPAWAGACGAGALLGALAVALRPAPLPAALRRLALTAGASVTLLLLAFVTGPLDARYDVRPAARLIAAAVAGGAPLASTSAYNGEFGFFARLTVPVEHVGATGGAAWCAAHPGGLVIDRLDPAHPPHAGARALYAAPYRGRALHLWRCAADGA
jgi:4-amino-4-deoxy-L-arabinose transferase-like glycosyltransferase